MNARFSAIAALRMGLALSLAAAVSLACGGDDITPPVDPPIPEPTVESVQISQSDVSFEYFGETVQLSATATDTDGNTMSGVSFSWASSSESVATVSNGRVMARGNGTATITATADNVSGGCSVTVSQVASKLGFDVHPTYAAQNTSLDDVQVAFWDAGNSVVESETGSISVAIGTNPGSGTLSGTTTQDAVAGVATFSGLSIDAPGVGYTLAATSGSLSAESLPFAISLPAVWVGLSDDDTLAANDSVCALGLATNSLVGAASVGQQPYRMEVSRDGGMAYLVHWGDAGAVTLVETPTYTPVATLSFTAPTAVAASETHAYVATCGGGGVQVISQATRSVVASASGGCFNSVALSPDGAYVYAGEYGTGIAVISTATNAEVDRIGVEGLGNWDLKITPNGQYAYSLIVGDTVVAVSLSAGSVVAKVPLVGKNPYELEITPDGSKVYVANGNDNTVSVISTSSNTVIATIPVGDFPWELDITPDGAYVYVSNYNDKTLSLIDTSTNTVVQTIPVYSYPTAVAVNPVQ